MATGKQMYEMADKLVEDLGLAGAKKEITFRAEYEKNSVKKAFWELILNSYIPKLEKKLNK